MGAETVAAPMEVPGTGRLAVLRDPQGASFALYQAQAIEK
jgi:predicted enzyme related to lactoylglutathione lyase